MLAVCYEREKNRVTVKGHAGFGEYGRDIVCAAASMLVFTLAEDLRRLAVGSPELYRIAELRLSPGDAELELVAAPEARERAQCVFAAVCAGFELLAAEYPQSVKYERAGGEVIVKRWGDV